MNASESHGDNKHGSHAEGGHGHAHGGDGDHGSHGSHGAHGPGGHTHGVVDASIASSDRGLWAVKWSFIGLFITASIQLAVVIMSNSVALLADTIHNFADASTAIPLAIAFHLAKRPPTKRYPFGLGRVEDLAGLAVVLTIFASALVAFYQAINRLIHPAPVNHLLAVVIASIIGFVGNEAVAIFRIRVGKEMGSAALIADGYHARTDGWTSLAVLIGAVGVYYGYPKADPIIGLFITIAILGIVWQSVKAVFLRMLDGSEPEVAEEVRHAATHVPGVVSVSDVRARWIGHRLRAEIDITVDPILNVAQANQISTDLERELASHLKFLGGSVIRVAPASQHPAPATG